MEYILPIIKIWNPFPFVICYTNLLIQIILLKEIVKTFAFICLSIISCSTRIKRKNHRPRVKGSFGILVLFAKIAHFFNWQRCLSKRIELLWHPLQIYRQFNLSKSSVYNGDICPCFNTIFNLNIELKPDNLQLLQ